MKKVLLILADGVRPDALAGNEDAEALKTLGTWTMDGKTVFPSVTLPCHISLFHSVTPERHGTTTNTYAPQVRPVTGLMDKLHTFGKECAMFYSWEQLRDISRPGSLGKSIFYSGHRYGYAEADERTLEAAKTTLQAEDLDFTFVYFGWPDEEGHAYGWMGENYLRSCAITYSHIRQLVELLKEEYTILITSDHGGHGRGHGENIPEDMTTPLFLIGPEFEAGKEIHGVSILDLAPTIAGILSVPPEKEWEGKNLTL